MNNGKYLGLKRFGATIHLKAMQTNDETALDPVCGMTVKRATAKATEEHKGVRYYFCCAGCATKFRADPEKYLQPKLVSLQPQLVTLEPKAVAQPTEAEQRTRYICPMDPEVSKLGPGSCPKCGMALEPETPSAPAMRTVYTCPMHPEVIRSAPGNCPKCGMALEPKEVTAEEENPELADMTRRLWIGITLAAPMLLLMLSDLLPSMPLQHLLPARALMRAVQAVFYKMQPFCIYQT